MVSMIGRVITCVSVAALGIAAYQPAASAQSATCESALSIAKVKKTDGLLPIYQVQVDDGVIFGIPKDGFDRSYILSTYFDQGVSLAVGNYLQSSIIRFEQAGNSVRIKETFANLTYTQDSPLSRTRDTTLSESRLLTLPVVRCSDENYLFVSMNKAALRGFSVPAISALSQTVRGLSLNRIEASAHSVEAYEDNINISVDLNISVPNGVQGAANGSSFSVRLAHSIIKLPDEGFVTRAPDPAVGYFSVNKLNLAQLNQLEAEEFIHRWRLEKKDPTAARSEPVKPILFWIENTTPYAFREPIRDGVLAWNRAFEEAGFLNAIQVKVQPDDAPWDAGNLNYNVIRWEASPFEDRRIGLGPSVFDPRTGEILAADILLNFTGVARRFEHWLALSDYEWKDIAPRFDEPDPGTPQSDNPVIAFNNKTSRGIADRDAKGRRLNQDLLSVNEGAENNDTNYNDISYDASSREKILALQPFQKPNQQEFARLVRFHDVISKISNRPQNNRRDKDKIRGIIARYNEAGINGAGNRDIAININQSQQPEISPEPTPELTPELPENQTQEGLEKPQQPQSLDQYQTDNTLSGRMIREVITDLVMHEVGHTLGLAHNFAGSQYHDYEDIHNQEKTNGVLSSSVMDYLPINFAPPGKQQGDFANTRVGPYDKWAVKFGYAPQIGDSGDEREKVLRKAGLPGYIYNAYRVDPSVFVFDLTNNPTAYALDNLRLVENIITDSSGWSLNENTETNREIFQRILGIRERAFSTILAQLRPYKLQIDRSFERSSRNRVVKGFRDKSDQIAALKALREGVLVGGDWVVPKDLNKRLGIYSFAPATLDGGQTAFSGFIIDALLNLNIIVNLSDAQKQGGEGLTVDEYFARVRNSVFGSDLSPIGRPSVFRQAQQYSYVKRLSGLISDLSEPDVFANLNDFDRITILRALKKEASQLKGDLFLPYFWIPQEYKQHRALLREMLD